jgi:hypothetical protein
MDGKKKILQQLANGDKQKKKKFNGGIWRKETRSEVRQNELFVVVY